MPSFNMVVVGSGGGPDETNLSAYLFKPYDADWEEGITALDAGSGKGALKQIIKDNPGIFTRRSKQLDSGVDATIMSAQNVYSCVRSFIITHAHLDHINSLVISAGSFSGPRKRILASKQTLHDLESVFNDRLWPKLASWDARDDSHKFLYQPLLPDEEYHPVSPGISARVMTVSHGHNGTCGVYDSSAIFIRHKEKEFLFFGDVEPDSISLKPRTIHVWRVAATKFPHTLSTIFIECSWSSGRPDDLLYGHLSPIHLVDELTALATEVVLRRRLDHREPRVISRPLRKKVKANPVPPQDLVGALDGLRVFITHCKDNDDASHDLAINHLITNQVRTLVESRRLGAKISAADQGMCIEI